MKEPFPFVPGSQGELGRVCVWGVFLRGHQMSGAVGKG